MSFADFTNGVTLLFCNNNKRLYIYMCNIVVSDGITINATTFIAEREIKLNLIVINHLHCT